MKNVSQNIKEKMIAKYLDKNTPIKNRRSTNINVLLNRVRNNQKIETKKKLYFSAAASTGLILFGFIIFQ